MQPMYLFSFYYQNYFISESFFGEIDSLQK